MKPISPRCSKTVIPVWIIFAAMACSDRPVVPRVTVTDSAGVRVTLTQAGHGVFVTLDSIPVMSLGGPDATGPTQFFGIQGIHLDSRNRPWVADGQSGELRIFQPGGSHWKTRGGRGEGPGEFSQIRLLGAGEGDSVLVGDGQIDRITVFDPEGEFVRTERVPETDRPAPRVFDIIGDGSVLGQVPRIVSASSLQPGQILPDSVELVRVWFDTSISEDYGTASGPLWLWTGRNQVPVPFTANASFDVVGDAVHLVSGTEFRVRVLEAGELFEIYGTDRGARPVGESDIASYRAFAQEYVGEATRDDYLSALDDALHPDHLPAYDRVLAGPDGFVWAQIYESDLSAPHQWDVFDKERRFVGQVSVPGGFYPMVITSTVLVGVWRDSLGVEHVRSYRLNGR